MQTEINICTQSMNITMMKPMESLRLKKTGPSVSGLKK